MSRIFMLIASMFVFAMPSLAGDKALLGALIGAGAGAAIGHSVNRGGGAGTGAAIGALGGYVIGSQMDKSAQQTQQAPQSQPPPAAQNTVQGGTQLAGGDCQTADNYVNEAANSRNNDDKLYKLQEAVRMCPNNARAHNDLGVAYYTRNGPHDRSRARDEFNEALRINPDYTVARNNLRNM